MFRSVKAARTRVLWKATPTRAKTVTPVPQRSNPLRDWKLLWELLEVGDIGPAAAVTELRLLERAVRCNGAATLLIPGLSARRFQRGHNLAR